MSKPEMPTDVLKQNATTIEFARHHGKKVLAGARTIGLPESEIAAMQERMIRWTEIVVTHENDLRTLRNNHEISAEERVKLAAQIRESLTEIRKAMFGE